MWPGEVGLSRREAEVMTWVAQGRTNLETAIILKLSRRTVEKHLEHIYQKLGVETRTAAAARVRAAASGEAAGWWSGRARDDHPGH